MCFWFFYFGNQWVTRYSLAGLLGAAFAHSFGDLSPWWRWRLSKVQDEEQQLPLFCVVPSHRSKFFVFRGNGQRMLLRDVVIAVGSLTILTVTVIFWNVVRGWWW